jgi:hypothetical protein
VSDDAATTWTVADDPALAAARARLDLALLGFNRHANLVEHFRLAVERFRQSREAFEAGSAERAALREARAAAALHRETVRASVGQFVRLLREAGMPPETALIAVKRRLTLSATTTCPGAPAIESACLETDAGLWAIKAYFEAA